MDFNETESFLGNNLSDEAITALLNNDLTNPEALTALSDFSDLPLCPTNPDPMMNEYAPLIQMWDMAMENTAFSIDKYEAETLDQIEASQYDTEMLKEKVKVEQMMLQKEKEQKQQEQTTAEISTWDDVSLYEDLTT